MTCTECGQPFVPGPDDDFTDEQDVCLECQREWAREHAPELLGEEDRRDD